MLGVPIRPFNEEDHSGLGAIFRPLLIGNSRILFSQPRLFPLFSPAPMQAQTQRAGIETEAMRENV